MLLSIQQHQQYMVEEHERHYRREFALERQYDKDHKRTKALMTLVTSVISRQCRDDEEH